MAHCYVRVVIPLVDPLFIFTLVTTGLTCRAVPASQGRETRMTVCRYFLQGNCRNGRDCRFEHISIAR